MSSILDKLKPTPQVVEKPIISLSKEELEFLLQKMRSATYRGDEFEMFYNVWTKILDEIDRIKE